MLSVSMKLAVRISFKRDQDTRSRSSGMWVAKNVVWRKLNSRVNEKTKVQQSHQSNCNVESRWYTSQGQQIASKVTRSSVHSQSLVIMLMGCCGFTWTRLRKIWEAKRAGALEVADSIVKVIPCAKSAKRCNDQPPVIEFLEIEPFQVCVSVAADQLCPGKSELHYSQCTSKVAKVDFTTSRM